MPQFGAFLIEVHRLLDADDLSDFLGVSRDSLYDRRHRGVDLPPAIRIGPRVLRWRIEDVERWLDERQEAGP